MFYVYLLASQPYGTLYIGTTSDLARRIWEHKKKLAPGFTKRYGVDQLVLVWVEVHQSAALRFAARSSSRNGSETGRLT
jgi:putative endonuclease